MQVCGRQVGGVQVVQRAIVGVEMGGMQVNEGKVREDRGECKWMESRWVKAGTWGEKHARG